MSTNYDYDTTPMPPLEYDQSKVPELSHKHANYVRNKTYGHDVRESLARGVEYAGLVSSVATKTAQDTQLRQDNLESYNDQVIIEMTDKDVISAPEIIEARNGRATLADRLEEDSDKIESVHAIVDKSAVNLADFGVVADGVTDDTAAMQLAINEAIATKKQINLRGTVNIQGTLYINKSFEHREPLVFAGRGTFIKNNDGVLFSNNVYNYAGNVRFINITFKSTVGSNVNIFDPKQLIRVYFLACEFLNVDHLMTSTGSDYAQTIYLTQCVVVGGEGFFIDLGTAYDVSILHSVVEHRDSLYKCAGTSYALRINNNVIEGMKGKVLEFAHGHNFSVRDNYFEANNDGSLEPYFKFTFGVPGNTSGVIENNMLIPTPEQAADENFSFIYATAVDENIEIKNNSHGAKLLDVLQEKSVSQPQIIAKLLTNKPYNDNDTKIVFNYKKVPVELGSGSLNKDIIHPNQTVPSTDKWLPNTNVSGGVTNKGMYIRAKAGVEVNEAGFKLPPISLNEFDNIVVGLEGLMASYSSSAPKPYITIFDSNGTRVYRENTGLSRTSYNNNKLRFVTTPSFKATKNDEYTIQISLYKDNGTFNFDTNFLQIKNLYVQYGTVANKSSI